MTMLYACDQCLFLFEADQKMKQCPDCGKFTVREATQSETEEFGQRKNNQDDWK